MRMFILNWAYRFGNNNNWWLKLHWAVILMLFFIGVVFIGVGETAPVRTDLSAADIAYIRLSNPNFALPYESVYLTWLRPWFWWSLVVLTVSGFVHIPFAFRDEFASARRAIGRKFREGKIEDRLAGGTSGEEKPSKVSAVGEVTSGFFGLLFKQLFVIIREVLGAALADILTHRKGS